LIASRTKAAGEVAGEVELLRYMAFTFI
jgi:hypothetical protein